MTQSRHSLGIRRALKACSARLHEHKVSEGIPLRADANHTGPVENEEASFRTKVCEHIKECCASSSRNTETLYLEADFSKEYLSQILRGRVCTC
jgi:hypothetical protein